MGEITVRDILQSHVSTLRYASASSFTLPDGRAKKHSLTLIVLIGHIGNHLISELDAMG